MNCKNIPAAEGGLEERDDAAGEEDGGDDVATGRIGVLHAQGRAEEERERHRCSHHRQVVLKCHAENFSSNSQRKNLQNLFLRKANDLA